MTYVKNNKWIFNVYAIIWGSPCLNQMERINWNYPSIYWWTLTTESTWSLDHLRSNVVPVSRKRFRTIRLLVKTETTICIIYVYGFQLISKQTSFFMTLRINRLHEAKKLLVLQWRVLFMCTYIIFFFRSKHIFRHVKKNKPKPFYSALSLITNWLQIPVLLKWLLFEFLSSSRGKSKNNCILS